MEKFFFSPPFHFLDKWSRLSHVNLSLFAVEKKERPGSEESARDGVFFQQFVWYCTLQIGKVKGHGASWIENIAHEVT